MAKIISICNQKGGTGKTTTAVNLSHALSLLGKKTLIVDTDPQGNATSGVGVNKNAIDQSVYDVLLNRASVQDIIIENICPGLDIMPCNLNLTGAEIELVGALSRETRLKKALTSIQEKYDYIFIDSPPSLGLLTLNALVASDSILIPIQCEFYALEGVSQLLHTINLIRDGLNQSLAIQGILLTMADFRTKLTTEVIKEIKSYFKDKVYETIITRNVKLSEAPSFGKPIVMYDHNSSGAKNYLDFAKEFLRSPGKKHNQLQDKELQKNSKEESETKSSDKTAEEESPSGNEIKIDSHM